MAAISREVIPCFGAEDLEDTGRTERLLKKVFPFRGTVNGLAESNKPSKSDIHKRKLLILITIEIER
jgi:hypothetical protein